jgi:hypothetical protein
VAAVSTVSMSVLARVARQALLTVGCGYHRLPDGSFAFPGDRPGADWHVHGWLVVRPRMRLGGVLGTVTVRKRRWRRADRSSTRHSRPPDDLGVRFDAVTVALELWCWLDAAVGLNRYLTPFDDGPDRRTVQRWLARAVPNALETQQAIRRAVIERSEPRPMETLFPAGLDPPASLTRRSWKHPAEVYQLKTGLYLLFAGALGLDVLAAPLLAEARGRLANPRSRFLL